MKSIQERILKGREFAYGNVNQPIDIELAFDMWDGIEEFLASEDRDTFNIIKKVIFDYDGFSQDIETDVDPNYVRNMGEWGDVAWSMNDSSFSHTQKIASKKGSTKKDTQTSSRKKDCTEEDVRILFEALIAFAKKNEKLSVVYTALGRCLKKMSMTPEQRKPHVNYGNNVAEYIKATFRSLQNLMSFLKKSRETMTYNTNSLTEEGIYMVTSGRNRMSPYNMLALLELGKKYAPGRFIRDIKADDFDLNADEFKALIKKRV